MSNSHPESQVNQALKDFTGRISLYEVSIFGTTEKASTIVRLYIKVQIFTKDYLFRIFFLLYGKFSDIFGKLEVS